MASNFVELAAYQRAVALAGEVYAVVATWPELLETEHWLRTAHQRGLLTWDPSDRIAKVARPLNGLIKKPTP